jgi:hypothetical protein
MLTSQITHFTLLSQFSIVPFINLSYLPTTTTMFAAAFNYLFASRTTRRNARVVARAIPVAAPTVLRPDRRTRAPTYETSSNRVGFGQAMVGSFDIMDAPSVEKTAILLLFSDKRIELPLGPEYNCLTPR